MAYTDLELAYLLTAYGQEVYGLALQKTKDPEKAEAVLQKVLIDLVNFPPALEGEALLAALLKKTQKLCGGQKAEAAPPAPLPEAVEEELLALMKEARDHEGILPPPAKKWSKLHTVGAACFGFLLVIGLTLALLFGGGGEAITDEGGSDSLLKPLPNQQTTPPADDTPDPPQTSLDPADQLYPFETVESDTCTTYTDLSAFVAAIEVRRAPGYGSGYYTARELLLLPNRLPDGALFRYLYLNPQTGNYSYSFQFEYQNTLYLLDFEITQTLPTSALGMADAIEAIREEKTTRTLAGTTLSATFGKDRITATLSAPESDAPIDEKIAKKLLEQTTLERCTQENPFLKVEN